jgi:hypothetical protein
VASGYEIQGVENRQVMLGMPLGMNCQQNPLSGSTCVERNQIALSFAESEPVQTRRNPQSGRNATTVSFSFGDDNGSQRASEIRQLFEAAQTGNAEAEAALRTLIGNRGQGRGGRGGGNNTGGNNAAGNNAGGNNAGGNNNAGNAGGFTGGGRGGRGTTQ